MADSILDIITKVNRPTITIDGEPYEIRRTGELSMADFHTLSVEAETLSNLHKERDETDVFDKFDKCCGVILSILMPDLPDDVRKRLSPFHVEAILAAFTKLSRTGNRRGERQSRKKSSRASSASTAAVRKTG